MISKRLCITTANRIKKGSTKHSLRNGSAEAISAQISGGAFLLADCCKNGGTQQAAGTGRGRPVVHGGLLPPKIIKRKAVTSNSTRIATAN